MKTLPSLIGRQKLLASYLYLIGSKVGRTLKFKHMLLLAKEFRGNYNYDFIPYKCGAYSFTMDNDLSVLERKHILENVEILKKYYLSISDEDKQRLVDFFENYKSILKNKDKTIKLTYEKYPYFAINSTIIDRYPLAKRKVTTIKKSLCSQKEEALFTIGYESKSIEEFFNQLIENNVKTLVDVRCNRKSMKFGFSEGKLSKVARSLGIEYIGISELGIESDKRKKLETMDDYKELFKNYKKSLSNKQKYFMVLKNILKKKKRIALMCFELDPEMCHRTILAKEFLKTYDTILKEL